MLATPVIRAMAMRTAAAGQLPVLATASARTSLLSRPCASTAATAGALVTQRRSQYMPVTGKRDQEAFLTQFDPMDVLGVETDCNISDIDEAGDRLKGKYGPNGTAPDAKMLDRVVRAYDILKDPDSPFYLRAHSSQTDRQRLQFQLLPKSKRRMIEVQVGFLMCVAFTAAFLLVKMSMQPMRRSLRSATR